MVYVCADDYGFCEAAAMRILQCADQGAVNKISIFPNFDDFDLVELSKKHRVSLHINLVEGRCMANAEKMDLITDEKGNFRFSFVKLLLLSLVRKKAFEAQVYQEIKTQVLFWKSKLPEGTAFCIDSHQHTHMIPAVFRILVKVLKDEAVCVDYLRIPAEPSLPYLKTPTLYLTYNAVNLIKHWLLKFLWLVNKPQLQRFRFPTALFFGVLFSGKMDEKRVSRVLPHYLKLAKKKKMDVEVLLHPGYVRNDEFDALEFTFEKFYLSQNRKTEYDTAMNIDMKEV